MRLREYLYCLNARLNAQPNLDDFRQAEKENKTLKDLGRRMQRQLDEDLAKIESLFKEPK